MKIKTLVLLAVLVFPTFVFAGQFFDPLQGKVVSYPEDPEFDTLRVGRYTVATLPTLTADEAGAIVQVTDGDGVTDCTSGGGTDTVMCRWTGSAWANMGDGQAEGSAEVQDEVFSAANFDGDTSHGVSQDDFYDLWHGVDADDDGSFADETWLTDYLSEAEAAAAYQPLDADLTAVAALTTDAYGLAILELTDQAGLVALLPSYQAEDADLTAVAALTTDAYGLALLELTEQAELVALLPSYQAADDDLTDLADGSLSGSKIGINGTTAETSIAADDLILIYDTSATANRAMTRGNFVTGIGAGQSITLDLEDDGGNDSTDLGEIATSGDTNNIFTESAADKLLIDLGQNWPQADTAVAASTQAISDNAIATVDQVGAADNDFAKFTANGLEGRSYTETRQDLGIDSAANLETTLSLGAYASDILGAADSDALVTLLGLVAGDIPDLSATYEAVDAEIVRADTADTIGADWEWQDGIPISFGNGNDWEVAYDETTDDRLEFTHTAGAGADVLFDLNDNAANSVFTVTNSNATYAAVFTADQLSAGAGGFTVAADGATVVKSLQITGASGTTGAVRIYEDPAYSTEYRGWLAQDNFTASLDFRFPNAVPTAANQFMVFSTPSSSISDITFAGLDTTYFDVTSITSIDTQFKGVVAGTVHTSLAASQVMVDTDGIADVAHDLLVYSDGTTDYIVVAMAEADIPSTGEDDYVITYDADANKFYMAAGGGGGSVAWDDITNPDAADEIDFAAYVTELNVEDLRIGDGGSVYAKFTGAALTFAGGYTITLPADSVDSSNYIDNSIDDAHINFGSGASQVDYSDITTGNISTSGTAATGALTVTGVINTSVGLDGVGAVDMDYGSGDITDHTFVSDGGTFIVDGGFTAGANSDMADFDLTSVDKLEGVDAAVFIDMGADGIVQIAADTAIHIDASDETIIFADGGADLINVTTDTGVATVDFGTINLATDALDLSEGNITNVGNIAIDSITADGTNVLFGTGAATQLQFRDTAIHIASADDGHLDLTADTSIDLNGAVTLSQGSNILLTDNNSVRLDATADGMDDDEYNGITITGRNAGEALTQWNLVRLANDADPWHQADADAAGEFPAIGIVVASASDTAAATVLVRGVVRNEGWTGLTPGGAVYLSDTAGGITQTAPSTSGDCVQIVGFALSDSEILFDFSRPYQEVE